ncbi:hypothetical protein TRFO_21464 [Tritrichomonas foetus]|uniref:ODAD1 central coiled coil region domain-containing protein n=1 Tax=Tritrichomonas foetus TaxID=1144522 RepID=A0A1J4KDS6_9EUKA|nr:hypothetical protein TRFO_21464 [Tritrichomonas foetus]|eukprot:OHT09583.1 hypothetical protein TRFO_21464 [Tritrichomonas foetus]
MENPAEVQELRNKLRMMKLPQEDILNVVRRQQRAIHKQKLANDTIRNEITEYEKQIANLDHDIEKYKTNEELQRLQQQFKSLTNKNSVVSADLAAEEGKRKKLEEEVSRANSKAGGFFKQSKENEVLQAQVRTMENRLDKALVRYNKTLTKLANMRAEIDECRKNRHTFRDVLKAAENELNRSDAHIADLIEISNDAYAERDRMKMELNRIKSAEKEDIQLYESELTRLNQTIEGQKITQNRPQQQSVIPSINSQLGSQSDQQEELVALTDQLQLTIQRTLDITKHATVQELFEAADNAERENFSLYNFVVEHGAAKSKLQDEIDALELQHKSLLSQVAQKDGEQSNDLELLTKKISDTQAVLDETLEKKQKDEENFTVIYAKIEELFNFLECKWDNAPDERTTVGPTNAMFCLSQIENVSATIMNDVCEKAKMMYQMRGQDPKTLLAENMSEISPNSKHIKPDMSVVIQSKTTIDSNKPLSLDELRAMIV